MRDPDKFYHTVSLEATWLLDLCASYWQFLAEVTLKFIFYFSIFYFIFGIKFRQKWFTDEDNHVLTWLSAICGNHSTAINRPAVQSQSFPSRSSRVRNNCHKAYRRRRTTHSWMFKWFVFPLSLTIPLELLSPVTRKTSTPDWLRSFTLDFKSLLTLKKIFLAEETSDKDATVKCTNGIKEQVLLASMHSSIPDHRWNAKKKKKKKKKEKGEKERERKRFRSYVWYTVATTFLMLNAILTAKYSLLKYEDNVKSWVVWDDTWGRSDQWNESYRWTFWRELLLSFRQRIQTPKSQLTSRNTLSRL